jgi:3-hydroxyacyl-CoA dehydrogenase
LPSRGTQNRSTASFRRAAGYVFAPVGNLSESARRRIAAVILIAGIAIAALAIADVGPFSDPATEEERAQSAVETFFAAAQDHDFKAACTQLTSEEQHAIEQRAASVATQQGLKGCDQILEAFLGDQLAGTRITKVIDVRVSGNQAVMDANIRTPGSKGTKAATFHMFLIKDEWKIDDFGV